MDNPILSQEYPSANFTEKPSNRATLIPSDLLQFCIYNVIKTECALHLAQRNTKIPGTCLAPF